MSQNQSDKLEEKVMSQIKSGRVKLRSKYIFLAEKLGLNSVLILSLLLAVLFFSLVLFFLKEADGLEYLSFGRRGLLAFLESFPYLLVAGLVALLFAIGYLITKTDWSYKQPFKYAAVGAMALVIAAGSVLAYSGVSKQLEAGAYSGHPLGNLIKPLFEHGLRQRGRSLAGVIFAIGDDHLVVETPLGLQKINLSQAKSCACGCDMGQFSQGQGVVAIGERKNFDFWANDFHVVKADEFPLIRRQADRRLGPFLHCSPDATNTPLLPPRLLHFGPDAVNCIQTCLHSRQFPPECVRGCVE